MVFKSFKKVVKVVAVAAVAAVVVAATAAVVVATAGAAAPAVVAAGVGVVGTGISAGAVASTAIAAGAAAAAVTAGVGVIGAVTETLIEEINGSMIINNTYTIGKEGVDRNTLNLVKTIASTATITSLREMTRSYHIAFAVSQNFSENGNAYNVGDLYISKQALTFDEAYAVLCAAGLVNSIYNITDNNDIINAVNNILQNNTFGELIDLIKGYQNKGYFAKRTMGIYANSPEAAATLAAVTGAWIDDNGFTGMGGSGGYYHFHDLKRNIHIWYGSKIV